MSIIRKAVLLAVATAAVMALAAPAASAQVEITRESTGAHCAAVTLTGHTVGGGCLLRAVSENENIALELNGSTVSLCRNTFESRVDENGSGYLYAQQLTGFFCFVDPCEEAGGAVSPWPVQTDEPAPGTEHLIADFCVDGPTGVQQCTLETSQTVVGHASAEFAAVASNPCLNNPNLHVVGHWDTVIDAAHPAVEITH